MTAKPETLYKLRNTIARYGPIVDTVADQYAHNIVSITLRIIAKEYGTAKANEAIEDFDLEAKGWYKHEEATNG